jgi:hypothetical protein
MDCRLCFICRIANTSCISGSSPSSTPPNQPGSSLSANTRTTATTTGTIVSTYVCSHSWWFRVTYHFLRSASATAVSASASSGGKQVPVGAIVGAVLGGVLIFAAIGLCLWRKRLPQTFFASKEVTHPSKLTGVCIPALLEDISNMLPNRTTNFPG